MCNSSDNYNFTCSKCGCHEFKVVRGWVDVSTEREWQACTCSRSEPVAWVNLYKRFAPLTESSLLGEDHTYEVGSTECDDEWVHSLYCAIQCEHCYYGFSGNYDPTEGESLEDYIEVPGTENWIVRCNACNRDIEFGWSGEVGDSEIWPVEAEDFDPEKVTPDPKFEAAWIKRGWL
jgi:hypothetical protein